MFCLFVLFASEAKESRFVTVSGGSLECFAGSDARLQAMFERRFGPCTGLSSRTDYEVHFRSRLSAAACWMALAPSRIVSYRSTRAEIEEQLREAAELKRQQEAEVSLSLSLFALFF